MGFDQEEASGGAGRTDEASYPESLRANLRETGSQILLVAQRLATHWCTDGVPRFGTG
jgi:hypothetical protein